MIDNTTMKATSIEITYCYSIIDSAILHSENIFASIQDSSYYFFESSIFKHLQVTQGSGGFALINN